MIRLLHGISKLTQKIYNHTQFDIWKKQLIPRRVQFGIVATLCLRNTFHTRLI